jgi:hypothetical protein
VREGGVVAQGLEVDEFDEDIRVLLRVTVVGQLFLDILNLPMDDVLLSGFVLGLADGLDQVSRLLAEVLRDFVVLEEIVHACDERPI